MTACGNKEKWIFTERRPTTSMVLLNSSSPVTSTLPIIISFSLAVDYRNRSFLCISHCFGAETVSVNRQPAGNGAAPFCVSTENILPQLHIYQKHNTKRPLNTWKYSTNKTSSGTESTSEMNGEQIS